jgi:hypothetical protein
MMTAFDAYSKEYGHSSMPVMVGGGKWKKWIWQVIKEEFKK